MNKTHQLVVGASFRFFVQQHKSQGAEPLHFCFNVFHLEGYMVQALTLSFHEPCDDTGRIHTLQ